MKWKAPCKQKLLFFSIFHIPTISILTFSLISKARLHKGSASLYLPLLPYNTAKLFNVAAT